MTRDRPARRRRLIAQAGATQRRARAEIVRTPDRRQGASLGIAGVCLLADQLAAPREQRLRRAALRAMALPGLGRFGAALVTGGSSALITNLRTADQTGRVDTAR